MTRCLFTGTPLLHDDKTTNKFGSIIHAYSMQRAVEDGTVTPLLYEERIPELGIQAKALDNWFDRITQPLSDKQKADLKKKFGLLIDYQGILKELDIALADYQDNGK